MANARLPGIGGGSGRSSDTTDLLRFRRQSDFGQQDVEPGSSARNDPQVVGVDIHGVDQVLDEHMSFSVVDFVPHGGDVDRGEQFGHFLESLGQLGVLGVTLRSFGVGRLEFASWAESRRSSSANVSVILSNAPVLHRACVTTTTGTRRCTSPW